jgi:transposase-like protein
LHGLGSSGSGWKMKEEHGVEVGHATLNRCVLKYVQLLEQKLRVREEGVGPYWRIDETM